MTHPNPSTALARVVIDELAVHGVRLAVISPGSRSAALVLAAAEHPEMETRVVIDERSAAFHALGAARASGSATAVFSTSGTAPANFYPAVIEADMACVPLVVVSADRPDELRGVGANQTIDQMEMFGTHVRRFVEIAAPDPGYDGNEPWRSTVATMMRDAAGPRPGPVHLNVAFREPTVPVSDDGRSRSEIYVFPTQRLDPTPEGPDVRAAEMPSVTMPADKGLVIAGDGEYDRVALMAKTAELGWPVLATALSGMRGTGALSAYHHLLASGVPAELVPSTVIAVGAIGPSPRLDELFAAAENRIRVDRWGRSIDPGRNATIRHHGDPVALLSGVDGTAGTSWSRDWEAADTGTRERLRAQISSQEHLTGAGVVQALDGVGWDTLVAASSLPIREVDAHLTRAGAVHANRGASGIDGFVSTALGVASVEERTLALAGDLSLLHDANGFLHDGEIDLVMVALDNGGGGLFDSLPVARHAEEYERLFVTPHHRDIELLARFHDLGYERVDDVEELVAACESALDAGGLTLVHVPVDRGYDLASRSQLES
jgi:2-succinyl-5-enolpyruvyl-6-hydroxy-3-cyclohexene-1-carboxylate synthase